MKKLLLLLIIPFLSFGQQEIELRLNEKIIMQDIHKYPGHMYGYLEPEKTVDSKIIRHMLDYLAHPGNAYLTTERFYFTTVKKGAGKRGYLKDKGFVKSFDYADIAKITYYRGGFFFTRNYGINKTGSYTIILKNGEHYN